MKVGIITCFESNEERCMHLKNYFINNNYDVDVYTSDFSHVSKSKRHNIPDDFIAIETKTYKNNLSVSRILSHIEFAEDVFKKIKNKEYDLIYVIAPCNSLIKQAKKYKKNHPNCKIIVDIIDMWPESLPSSFNKHSFPFSIWRNIRKDNIEVADYLICECNLYQKILKEEYSKNIKTIYLSRDKKGKISKKLDDSELSLLYIGSINNIIDIDKIALLIGNINYPVKLHVVGSGEKLEEFKDKLTKVCNIQYHGPIYDEDEKAKIFNTCHAGINIYKDNLYIGLTTKCLDYFMYGLPIINNIQADTFKMVEEYNLGINVIDTYDIDVNKIIELAHNNKHIINFYDKYFSVKAFNDNIDEVIKHVMEK